MLQNWSATNHERQNEVRTATKRVQINEQWIKLYTNFLFNLCWYESDLKCLSNELNYMKKCINEWLQQAKTSLPKKKLFWDLYNSNSLSTWKPEVLSFLQQTEWSLWGKSSQQVEQNFHTYLKTPSGKIKTRSIRHC